MEQKRELTLEEMDKVSGGNGSDSWGRNPDLIDCPSCGMPVATSAGITSGECPYCHKPIPIDTYRDINTNEDPKPVKIL